LFANSILTGRYIEPASVRRMLPVLSACVLLAALLFCGLNAVLSFGLALPASALVLSGFCGGFFVLRLWIDPLIPASAVAVCALASAVCALVVRRNAEVRLRLAVGRVAGEPLLRKLARKGVTEPQAIAVCDAAIAVVRRPALPELEGCAPAEEAAAAFRDFRAEACRAFIAAGGVVVGCGGDEVCAAFGSPLERLAAKGGGGKAARKSGGKDADAEESPTTRAARALDGLFASSASAAEMFAGVDYGECAFTYGSEEGYTVCGSVVARSRSLADMARRGKTRTLFGKGADLEVLDKYLR
jgi:class 3 adenylate cyclase